MSSPVSPVLKMLWKKTVWNQKSPTAELSTNSISRPVAEKAVLVELVIVCTATLA